MKLLILLLIASCSSYFPPIRGSYRLTTLKHFMVSNMYVNPANLSKEKNNLLISYDVIVKNVNGKRHNIDLSKSRIKVGTKEYPMNCHRFKETTIQFDLDAGEQTRVQCLGVIDKTQFVVSDYQTMIEIPLDQDVAKFEYLLRTEDFK